MFLRRLRLIWLGISLFTCAPPYSCSQTWLPFMRSKSVEYADKKLAVLIEFRNSGLIVPVLHNFVTHLTRDWNFAIVHGPGRLHLIEFSGREPASNMEYSSLLREAQFWERLQAEHILIFQVDAALCKRTDLSAWLKYAYVGAPWARRPNCPGIGPLDVGNGGLSLRRRSDMLKILAEAPVPGLGGEQPEDVFFGCMARRLNMSTPSAEEAQLFAMEQVPNPHTTGFHQIKIQMGGIEQAESAARAANCSAFHHIFLNGRLQKRNLLFIRKTD